MVAARESPITRPCCEVLSELLLSLLSLHRAFPAAHLAVGVLTPSACHLTRTTQAFSFWKLYSRHGSVILELLVCDVRCCLSVGMFSSFLILTLHCQRRTRRGTRHLDLDMNCFLEQLKTGCCLRNLIVFGTKLRMLILPDLRGLRDALDCFSDALCHRARCWSVGSNCSVKSGIDTLVPLDVHLHGLPLVVDPVNAVHAVRLLVLIISCS